MKGGKSLDAAAQRGSQRTPARKRPERQVEPPEDRTRRLRGVVVGVGYTLGPMVKELDEMRAVLLGHKDPPIYSGALTLMEVADAYFARAADMSIQISRAEATGQVEKGSRAYLFRTQELRLFMEIAKRAADLGSRRITYLNARLDAERTGRSDFDSVFAEDDDA